MLVYTYDMKMSKAIQQNHNVYDFQAEELIGDLDNYKDTTHYKPEINDWMTRCFYNNNNLVNNETIAENETKLLNILQKFSINNHDWYGSPFQNMQYYLEAQIEYALRREDLFVWQIGHNVSGFGEVKE